MRTKSKYREIQPDNSAQNIPAEKELPATVVSARPEGPAVAVTVDPPSPVNATGALKAQLEALKQSEELHRQRQAQALQPPPVTREQRLALWKQQGLSEAEMDFLRQNPQMIDFPQITSQAASEAMQAGHQRDSDSFREAMTVAFDNHLKRLAQQATAEQPTPEFFQPPPPPKPPTRSNIVSAPVSREVPSGRPREENNPNRMTLSAEEMQIARASGISATDYARGKLRLQREKAAGERQ
jgi:hypothetical protein